MLSIVIIFSLVTVVTELLVLLSLPRWMQGRGGVIVVSIFFVAINLLAGWGTVTGVLCAKLAALGSWLIVHPIMKWYTRPRTVHMPLRVKVWRWFVQ